jgi:hypothetical protein
MVTGLGEGAAGRLLGGRKWADLNPAGGAEAATCNLANRRQIEGSRWWIGQDGPWCGAATIGGAQGDCGVASEVLESKT